VLLVRGNWEFGNEFQAESKVSWTVLHNQILIQRLNKNLLVFDQCSVHIVLADFRVPGKNKVGNDNQNKHEKHHQNWNSVFLGEQKAGKSNTNLS